MGPKISTDFAGLVLGACCLAGFALQANGLKGYLPTLGPSSLAFQTRPASAALPNPIGELNNLPKARLTGSATNSPTFTGEPSLITTNSSEEVVAVSQSEPVQPANAAELGTLPAPDNGAAPEDPSRAARAVLVYLMPVWTNSVQDKLIPPGFVPPAPPPPLPSSHATYESR